MNRHDELGARKWSVDWFRAGVAAFVVTVVAHVLRTAAVVHGVGADVVEGIEIAAVVLGIGCFFRWAVVHERAKRLTDS